MHGSECKCGKLAEVESPRCARCNRRRMGRQDAATVIIALLVIAAVIVCCSELFGCVSLNELNVAIGDDGDGEDDLVTAWIQVALEGLAVAVVTIVTLTACAMWWFLCDRRHMIGKKHAAETAEHFDDAANPPSEKGYD